MESQKIVAKLETFEPKRKTLLPMARRGLGSKGRKIQLLANHLSIRLAKNDGFFYHYNVALSYQDGHAVEVKGVGRKVIDKLCETYDVLKNINFAYDGEKSLFTLGSLQHTKHEFLVVLEEVSSKRVGRNDGSFSNPDEASKKMRRESRSKTFKVEISYAAKIPLHSITSALRGQDSGHSQEALRVLDIILRQHASKKGYLLIRQSFFVDDPRNLSRPEGGLQVCSGLHSSFRATQVGLSLNVDVSTTLLLKPGPVVDFLLMNQNVNHPNMVDWAKAKRTLKNLRIKANNIEYKITGLSENPCRTQKFLLKQGKDQNGEMRFIETTVYEYYKHVKKIELCYSANFPCINIGKPKLPVYFPLELCTLVPLQRYTKALSSKQRSQLIGESRKKPNERKAALQTSLGSMRYDSEPMLCSSGITIEKDFMKVEGRVLPPPKLVVGNRENFFPNNGLWNFNNKKLVDPMRIERWALVNFSSRCDIRPLLHMLQNCAQKKGVHLDAPLGTFEENGRFRNESASVRVERMYEILNARLPNLDGVQLLLCILPVSKNSDIYGPWKRKCLTEKGIATQCIVPPARIQDQYITNVLLKINAKLGGINSFLLTECEHTIPLVSSEPTLIIGMDVSHGSPGQSSTPSIAAVVSSRYWPFISRYRAAVRTQSSKVEMISSLFKPKSDTEDDGIIRELLIDFYRTSNKRRPKHIIIFRDGVSESQFNQVLNIELDDIIKACKHLDENWFPKFTLIVGQKNHHTRFFDFNASNQNVPAGTVIDNTICHPKNNDFYMCAHAGRIGTTRPTHYHALYDEIGFSADNLQELVHSLCYVYQRSTSAVSIVAPIYYAHLAAAQMGKFIKFDEFDASSSYGGISSTSVSEVPELPRLQEKVINSMFFC